MEIDPVNSTRTQVISKIKLYPKRYRLYQTTLDGYVYIDNSKDSIVYTNKRKRLPISEPEISYKKYNTKELGKRSSSILKEDPPYIGATTSQIVDCLINKRKPIPDCILSPQFFKLRIGDYSGEYYTNKTANYKGGYYTNYKTLVERLESGEQQLKSVYDSKYVRGPFLSGIAELDCK